MTDKHVIDREAFSEHDMQTCKYVQDCEESYEASCKHNNTTPDDFTYFRRYTWNLFALLMLRIEELERGEP